MSEVNPSSSRKARRNQPSDDPLWAASRFAWLYVTMNVFGACFASALWLADRTSSASAFFPLVFAALVALCAPKIRRGSASAMRVAASIAVLDAAGTLAFVASASSGRAIALIPWALPIGIRLTLAYEFSKPLRARPVTAGEETR